jgi:hypothetical protein
MAYTFALNPFTTYSPPHWRTHVIFRVWYSVSDAKLGIQPGSVWHSGTFAPPDRPPDAVSDIREALLRHLTYEDYARKGAVGSFIELTYRRKFRNCRWIELGMRSGNDKREVALNGVT